MIQSKGQQFMFRRSLFLGLTLMLAAVLVFLVIQGRRQEKLRQSTPRTVEVLRQSTPSLTRVIAPDDLDIVESKMELGASGTAKNQTQSGGVTAIHRVVIRNNGRTAYHSLALQISYLGRGNKMIESRTVPAAELLQPGQARSIVDLKVENVPAGTLKCEVKIAYAELEPIARQP